MMTSRKYSENGKVFVLQNIPINYNVDLIIDFVESTLDTDVEDVKLHPFLPGRALVYLKQKLEDFTEAEKKISEGFFDSKKVKLLMTFREPAVVVHQLDIKKLSEEFLCLYFECEFADGYEVIESSKTWPELNIAVVHFHQHKQEVVEKILKQDDLVPLPSEDYHISIQPFYNSFHNYIGEPLIQNERFEPAAAKKNCLTVDCSGENQKKVEIEIKEDEIENKSKVEEDEDEDMDKEEEEEDMEVNEENRKINEDEDETDSDEGSNIEDEVTNSESIKTQLGVKEKEKDLQSQKISVAVRGAYKGTDVRKVKGGLTEPPRRGAYAPRGERRKVDVGINRDDRKRKLFSEQNEDSDLEKRFEDQKWESSNIRGRGRGIDDVKQNSNFLPSCGSTNTGRSNYEANLLQRGAKQQNYRGRGGTAYLPRGARSVQSTEYLSDGNDMTENQNNMPSSFDISSNFDQNAMYGASFKSPDSYVPGPSNVYRKPPEKILNASVSKNKPELNTAFKKVQIEHKNRLENELAAKQEQIKHLQEELEKKNYQQKQHIETIPMTHWQKEFLSHIFGNFDNCRVYFDHNEGVAILDGKLDCVKDHQLKLLKELKKLKEELLALTPAMCGILSREHGKQYLHKLNSFQLNGAKAFLQDESLLVTAKDAESLNFAVDFLKDKLNYKETTTESNVKIPTDKLHLLQSKLENKFLVRLSWTDTDPVISIEGMKDDVYESRREIAALEEEHGVHEKTFSVTGSCATFLHKHMEEKIKQFLHNVEIVNFASTLAQVDITFKGDRKTVNQVHRNLTQLKTQVTTKSWDLTSEFKKPEDLMLITKGYSSEKMKMKITSFEITNKCIVIEKLPSSEVFTLSKKFHPAHSTRDHSAKIRREFKSAAPEHVESKLIYTVTNTCQLVVKPYGDITRESSDVLVCIVANNVDLRKTRVGQTFNKVCPTLWKSLKAEQELHPNEAVLTTKGNFTHLKCQAICHIILTSWNPNTSPALLSNAIQSVINQAVALGAKSVSFPVLGCGRAFAFPAGNVAQITLATIKSSNLGNTIQKVVLLAPDNELFKEFKIEAPKHFQATPVQGAVGGASPDETITDEADADDTSDESEESEDNELHVVLSQKLQKSVVAEISIVHDKGTENLWSLLKKDIAKVCLHTQYFSQDLADFWPKESRNNILQEAKKLCVWVERFPNPKTKKPGYIIKGEKQNVTAIYSIINKEFTDLSACLPKHRIKSDNAPKRGTQEFLRHAARSDEDFPLYWKLNRSKTEGILSWGRGKIREISSGKNKFLVDVDTKVKDAIKKLISKTWDKSLVGQGHDAAGLSYTGIKVVDVKRLENKDLFEQYSRQRQTLFKRMCDGVNVCQDIGRMNGSKNRVKTTELLENFMKEELYYEINEHYLFHGTKNPDAICSNGIDPRVSSEGGMFGKGIYTAEMFIKSDQYTDSRSQRSQLGTTLTMILARVLLGNVFLCNEHHKSVANKQATKLTRPPCVSCKEDKCNCKNQTLFDSVMGDGKWMFREFVVYDKSHCYPEYVIYYQRV